MNKQIERKKVGKPIPQGHVGTPQDFCSVVEAVTFGIRDGKAFALMSKDWTPENRIEWAKANVQFFQALTDRIDTWGKLTATENGLEY